MTEVQRKKGESFESFLRRFNKVMVQSGKLIQARRVRFLRPKMNSNRTRVKALRRNLIVQKREYLQRIGKLPDNDSNKRRRS